jgi:putative FmdB family regulatory protein
MSPIYEYICETCGAPQAIARPVSEAALGDTCPHCGGSLRKLFSVPTIQVHRDASDVLNRAAAGDGDPVPGMTREETLKAARAHSRGLKQGRSNRQK